MKDNHSSDEHQQKVDVWENAEYSFYNKVLRPDTEKTYRDAVRLFSALLRSLKMCYR